MDNNGTAAERSAGTPLGSREQLPAPLPPSTPPPNHASDVLVIEPDGSRDSEDAQPDSLHPLTTMAPSTPHSHAGLPIGRSRSISSISRARSDSLTSSSRHGPTTGNAAPTGSPTQTASRPAIPGGAAALVIPNNLSRISVHSLSGASPVSPTQSSATHIGNILAPASFFRPARPSQQGQHHAHQYNTISSVRSIPHSIGPAPTGSTSPRNSLALPARPMMPGTSITNSPRKSGAIPDGAIPLTSFAVRRASVQSKRMSHGSASASDGEDVFGGTFHSSSLVVEEDPSAQHQQARPMASREPLLTPHEQLSAQQQQQQPSPVASQGMRGSIERIFRRSFSGESLKHSGGVPRTPKTAQTPHSANALIEEPHDEAKSDAPSRHPRFAPLPPRAQLSGVVNPSWMQPILTPSGRPVRNYELHRGANRFFLGGRLMLGGDMPWAFVGTLGVYCVVVGFWMGTTCVYWWHHLSPALAIVGAYMALVTLSSLLATAFRDPGILPRDLDLDAPLPMVSDTDSSQPTPLPREIRVRDEVVRTKYCVTCRTYRPPRSSHCRNCDNCVDGCDHHCPWVNNCVGRRNYGSFIICLVSAVTSLILIIVTSAIHLEVLSRREHLDFERTLREGFGSAVTFVAASIVIWPVSILMGYHVRLLYLNTTTIEQVRNKAHKSLGAGAGPLPPNPFTYGRWWYNMAYLLCRPPGYSWIAPEEIATEDKRVRCEVDEEEEDDEDGEEGYDDEQRWSRSVGA